jgi:DNA-binding CsgD family transcriptional regulator
MLPHTKAHIAIIESQHLPALGLKTLLNHLVPFAEITIYNSFEALENDVDSEDGPKIVHFFVSSKIIFNHTAFFSRRQQSTIILTSSNSEKAALANSPYRHIDITAEEGEIVKALLEIHGRGHENQQHSKAPIKTKEDLLSEREQEVLKLVAQGYLNKEIAQMLNISITTVITHRKNITEKLGLKSIASLTIYAVVNGLVDYSSI